MRQQFLLSIFFVMIVPFLAGAGLAAEEMAFVTSLEEIEWGAPGGGNGFPLGVQTARLGVDPQTGGITYYALFPAGSHFDLHWHTHHEYVAVLRGRVDLVLGQEQHALVPGSYIVIPGSLPHSWDVPDTEAVIILVRRAGPADFHFIDP